MGNIKTSKNTSCLHCYPSQSKHVEYKINSILDFYLGNTIGFIFQLFFVKRILNLIGQYIKKWVLEVSQLLGQTQLSTEIKRSQFDNCILAFWDEAKKRNLPIFNVKINGTQTQLFCLKLNDKKYYFDRNPIYPIIKGFFYNDPSQFDDKSNFKKILLAQNAHCPTGSAFISRKKALKYGCKLGFPLLVKPTLASSSIHVSFNIQSQQELMDGINIAKEVNYKFLVEQFIPGDVHRAVVLDKKLVACAKRQPGLIVGNGKDTVEKLIDQKNKHPWRGEPQQLDSTLHKVEKNSLLVDWLATQNLTLKTKLKKSQQVFLSRKMNVGNGADIIDVTAHIHPENVVLFEAIHKKLKVQLSGFDFICKDVSLPWQEQVFSIIEYNSLPGISIHHFPSEGEPINVASKIWDYVLTTKI